MVLLLGIFQVTFYRTVISYFRNSSEVWAHVASLALKPVASDAPLFLEEFFAVVADATW